LTAWSAQLTFVVVRDRRTGIFWRHCYELEKLALDGVIADDKLIISAEIKIESCTLLD
jgi:hypothetical protein